MTDNWKPIDTAPDGVVVLTKIDDGRGERNVQKLKKQSLPYLVKAWKNETNSYYQFSCKEHNNNLATFDRWDTRACSVCRKTNSDRHYYV